MENGEPISTDPILVGNVKLRADFHLDTQGDGFNYLELVAHEKKHPWMEVKIKLLEVGSEDIENLGKALLSLAASIRDQQALMP